MNNITSTISYSNLYNKYRSNYFLAFQDLFFHIFILSLTYTSIYYFRNIYILSIPLIFILGLLKIKTFTIFHDCGHNTYTPSVLINNIIGIITGIFVFNPFSWKFNHNTHHLVLGNINNKYNYGFNDTVFHTLNNYKSWSFLRKTLYKTLLHPLIFFLILAPIKFILINRINALLFIFKKKSVNYSYLYIFCENVINNIGIYIYLYLSYNYNILLNIMIANIIGSILGVALFHNQHTYNPNSYVVYDDKLWNQQDAGLKGSSFIQIPWYLKYFTGGIEYHHIHHMNAKIPAYNLHKYHNEFISKSNLFDNITKLTLHECYNNLWLKLYDENDKQYITFKEADIKTK